MHWASIESVSVGQQASIRQRITPDLVRATAEVTGDFNPLHVDGSAAAVAGQSRPVAHGVILLGMISRLIGMELPGPGSVWFENDVQFLAPVYPDDEVEITATVARVSIATSVVELELEGRKQSGAPVLQGRARVRVSGVMTNPTEQVDQREYVALVTGASRGVGRTIAEALGRRGMRVVVNYRTDRNGAEETVAALQQLGCEATAVAADVSDPSGARTLYETIATKHDRLDMIVHNATPPIVPRNYLETSLEEFRAFFDTYVIGFHELIRLAAPGMKERKFGRIVGILSSYTAEVPAKFAAYITGKNAMLGFCRALAVELGPWNITVNTVSPSMLLGRRTDELGMAAREVISRKTPLRRLGQPADVGPIVAFLAGPEAAFISGANIPVTGGILL
jgi:3-oxoacyl-[acyl-carrier protein] reductase